jgi:hypothetical protein
MLRPILRIRQGARPRGLNNDVPLFFLSDDDEENVPGGDLFCDIQNIPVEVSQAQKPIREDDPFPHLHFQSISPISQTLPQILEIILDIEPEHALGLVQEHLPAFGDSNDNSNAVTSKERATRATEHVIGLVFEAGAFSKALNKKGKVRAVEVPERENK